MNFILSLIRSALLRLSVRWQRSSGVRRLELWDLKINDKGHLAVQGMDAVELVSKFDSPLLVVNKEKLMTDVEALKSAFARAPEGSRILYSYKTNCVPGILKAMHEVGLGAEVISPYELWLAVKLGVPGEMILYNGVDKSDESLELAVRIGVFCINIDHVGEIERIRSIAERVGSKANVGVRLALSARSQFGLDIESGEALDACKRILALPQSFDLRCIHVHLTSNAKDASTHRGFATRALRFARDLKSSTGYCIPYLDLGGGFGVPTTKNMTGAEYGIYRLFGVLPRPPRLEEAQHVAEFMRDLVDAVEQTCGELQIDVPRLIIEPGRLATSRAEFLLARVHAIKERDNGPLFAITDAGRLSLTFPCDFEYHEVFVAGRPTAALDTLYDVTGRVCTSADWMFRNRLLPKLQAGDVLAVMDAGAYFSSYSTNFAFPRCAIVMVDAGNASVIRGAETFEHLTALDRY